MAILKNYFPTRLAEILINWGNIVGQGPEAKETQRTTSVLFWVSVETNADIHLITLKIIFPVVDPMPLQQKIR